MAKQWSLAKDIYPSHAPFPEPMPEQHTGATGWSPLRWQMLALLTSPPRLLPLPRPTLDSCLAAFSQELSARRVPCLTAVILTPVSAACSLRWLKLSFPSPYPSASGSDGPRHALFPPAQPHDPPLRAPAQPCSPPRAGLRRELGKVQRAGHLGQARHPISSTTC